MWKQISYLQKNMVWSIPAFMVFGILFGYFSDSSFLKSLILPLTFLMVYPMMVNLQLKKVFSLGDTRVQIFTQIINFGIIPFVAFGIGKLFFADKPLIALGLLLASLLPTSGMTISWTGFAKGNLNAAIKMTIIGLVVGSLATPFYAKWLMGTVVEIPLLEVFKQIALIVFLPMIVGYGTQRFILWKYGEAKYNKDIKSKFPMISTLGVLGIVFVAMALKAKTVVSQPSMLVYLLMPLLLLYGINFILSTIIAKYFFNRGDGIALVYGTVMRNLSIALAIAMTVFGTKGPEVALIIAVAYIIQVQAGAWYIKFTDKFFGPAPEAVAENIMELGIFAVHDKQKLSDVVKLLDEEHIHSVAVLDNKENIKGIITSEMIINHLAEGKSLNVNVEKIKLHEPILVKESTPIKKVLNKMKRKHGYKVIVVNTKGEPEGVLTDADVLDKYLEEKK